MNISTNTRPVATHTRLAVGALGIALVSSLAVGATPASATRRDLDGTAVTTSTHHPVVLDPGELLAQRKSLIDPRWWVRLGNLG
jgi:hypothetical protein